MRFYDQYADPNERYLTQNETELFCLDGFWPGVNVLAKRDFLNESQPGDAVSIIETPLDPALPRISLKATSKFCPDPSSGRDWINRTVELGMEEIQPELTESMISAASASGKASDLHGVEFVEAREIKGYHVDCSTEPFKFIHSFQLQGPSGEIVWDDGAFADPDKSAKKSRRTEEITGDLNLSIESTPTTTDVAVVRAIFLALRVPARKLSNKAFLL